ncbi:recombinase family protein [Geomonas subterranea]|uniref:Recombinase family protein n=1 Tax=Geomonas subterranea TaxID=2847989 RepID=A0ABX8LK98_9BACT|nr:recombinase family protein [Geomonas subterranea]QXE92448.1 recombinase family protein [Geomonas subterranea]QXM09453.1 recombinase family protein [Geomonas subterranea]
MEYVSYLRVSTDQQAGAGNGIEAQRKAIEDFAAAEGSRIVKEYIEVESGADDGRPIMREALVYAQLRGAILLVKTLDRISRDLHFITALEKSEVAFKIVDMPTADSFTLHIYGSLAERERQLISIRTKAALAAVKARGVILGKPENLTHEARAKGRQSSLAKRMASSDDFASKIGPIMSGYRGEGLSFDAIAKKLNEEGLKTKKGGAWAGMTVKRVLDKIRG